MPDVWRVGDTANGKGSVMPKTTKPLTILLHPQLEEFFREEKEAGHRIITSIHPLDDILGLNDVDMAIGPNCWRMTPDLIKHKPVAIKAGRKMKEEKK